MPLRRRIPIDFYAAKPAPLAGATGKPPGIQLSVLMKIGRVGIHAAAAARVDSGLPQWRCISTNLTTRMAFCAAMQVAIALAS